MESRRIKAIKIRVTESEFAALSERSKKPRLAEWMREHCLDASVPRSRKVPDVDPALLRQLASIGNNLNQIARTLNQKSALERIQLISMLTSIQRELDKIREEHSSDR